MRRKSKNIMELSDFGLEAEVEVISPAQAEAYLRNNVTQKRIVQNKVDKYLSQLRDGRWRLNGKVIVFDKNGRLLGGQHRLGAVVQSGVSLTTVVIRGVEPDVLETNK